MKRFHMAGFELLGNAIVLQAVEDYREARQAYANCNKDYGAKSMMLECESFFLSERFCIFTNVDGKALLEKLKEEVR